MMSRHDNGASPQRRFDPDAAATGDGIYGLPFTPEKSAVILIPVPWEATVSYRAGTAGGPQAILAASRQVDLYDRETGRPYRGGIAMLPIPSEISELNRRAREAARPIIECGGIDAIGDAVEGGDTALADDRAAQGPKPAGEFDEEEMRRKLREVNRLGELVNSWVYGQTCEWLNRGKLVGVVGGDHSSPFGLIRALAERRPGVGILQIDAHADLRKAYEGFEWSHASIFHNVMERIPGVSRLVQVGIRDFAAGENSYIESNAARIRTHFEVDLRSRMATGETWMDLVREIVGALPQEVYVSFDIDGLDPALCPNTGTPVPGGLSFAEVCLLLGALTESGRRIVGFDLCEVAPDPNGRNDWDANVGARILYKMIGWAQAGAERTIKR